MKPARFLAGNPDPRSLAPQQPVDALLQHPSSHSSNTITEEALFVLIA
jgi:hypothetical protein